MFETLGDTIDFDTLPAILNAMPENPVTRSSRLRTCPPGHLRTGRLQDRIVCETEEDVYQDATKDRQTEVDPQPYLILGGIILALFLMGKGRR